MVSTHGAPEAPRFRGVKSHPCCRAGKVGVFLLENLLVCPFLIRQRGIFSHRPGEKPEFFMRLKNLSKNQGLKWLFLGFLSMWWNKPPNRPTALKRPRPKVSNRACGVLALVIERDIFFYRSESPSVRSYGFCWLSLFHSILAIFYSSLW